jgi:hypothetical protein
MVHKLENIGALHAKQKNEIQEATLSEVKASSFTNKQQ